MKQATCKELRGACDVVIYGSSPDEMGDNVKKHVAEMLEQGDQAHLDAIEAMKQLSMMEFMKWKNAFDANFHTLKDAE